MWNTIYQVTIIYGANANDVLRRWLQWNVGRKRTWNACYCASRSRFIYWISWFSDNTEWECLENAILTSIPTTIFLNVFADGRVTKMCLSKLIAGHMFDAKSLPGSKNGLKNIQQWYFSWDAIVFTRGQFWPSGTVVARVCLCVRPSVRVCGNHLLVRAITHHPFKLGSPNLDHRRKRPRLRSLSFFFFVFVFFRFFFFFLRGWLTLTFKVKFSFRVKSYPILSLSARKLIICSS